MKKSSGLPIGMLVARWEAGSTYQGRVAITISIINTRSSQEFYFRNAYGHEDTDRRDFFTQLHDDAGLVEGPQIVGFQLNF